MRVTLTHSDFNLGYELFPVNQRRARRMRQETGEESVLFQVDRDFPGLASALGWNARSAHKRGCSDPGSTDGTVACRGCGRGAGAFISAAQEWLDKRCDTTMQSTAVEGYFE